MSSLIDSVIGHIDNDTNYSSVVFICDHKTQPEGIACQQLRTTAKLPHIITAAGMPDLHAGRGYPIGAAFFSVGHFYPALIGSDIGCGMALFQSDLPLRKQKLDKLTKRIGNFDDPLSPDDPLFSNLSAPLCAITEAAALGTIGGGNHFAEILQTDAVFHPEFLPENYDPSALQLLVHSGSRGFGGRILREHIETFGHAGLPAESPEGEQYLAAHQLALSFARKNRELIAARIGRNLGGELSLISDSSHNQLSALTLKGRAGWLHRKGAAPSDQGLVVIAGSRGDHSYLVKPTEKAGENLASIAHGAGRKWVRGACKARLSHKYRPEEMRRNRFGGRIICEDKTLLYDEAPQAYRNIEHTINALKNMGFIIPVARLTPMLTYKTRGGGK